MIAPPDPPRQGTSAEHTQAVRAAVLICTHNRSARLDKCLDCLARQTVPPSAYDIIVVNNASTDNTAEVCRYWRSELSNLHYIYELRLGLSVSRNTGVRTSTCSHVIFLDDDCTVLSTWLGAYLSAFARYRDIPCFGGRIEVDWAGREPPPWLARPLWPALGHIDHGTREMPVSHVNGGNMAWKRARLLGLGGFPEQLGRVGRRLIAGEESELQTELRRAGDFPVYIPGAVAFHWTPPERQRLSYLLAVFYGLGCSGSLRYHLRRRIAPMDSLRLLVREFHRLGRVCVGIYRLRSNDTSVNFGCSTAMFLVEFARVLGFARAELALVFSPRLRRRQDHE